MAVKLTKLRPYQGFSAETGGALILLATANVGFPVSHDPRDQHGHRGRRGDAAFVRCPLGRRAPDRLAWILTLPAAILFAYLVMAVFRAIGLG